MDVQRNGSDVAYIHIGNAEIHQHVCEAVTFALPWKRKREKEHDTIEDLDMSHLLVSQKVLLMLTYMFVSRMASMW